MIGFGYIHIWVVCSPVDVEYADVYNRGSIFLIEAELEVGGWVKKRMAGLRCILRDASDYIYYVDITQLSIPGVFCFLKTSSWLKGKSHTSLCSSLFAHLYSQQMHLFSPSEHFEKACFPSSV